MINLKRLLKFFRTLTMPDTDVGYQIGETYKELGNSDGKYITDSIALIRSRMPGKCLALFYKQFDWSTILVKK